MSTTGVTDTKKLTASAIVLYASKTLAAGWSPHTIKARVVILKRIWRDAQRAGLSPISSDEVPPVRAPRKIIVATPQADIMRLLTHCESLEGNLKRTQVPRSLFWRAFIAASYETAMRTSDVRLLRYNSRGEWHVIQTKTSRPVSVSIGEQTRLLLAELRKYSPNLLDVGWCREAYCKGLQKIGRKIGVPITPQQLRQTAASDAERQQPGSAWILLGHSSPDTTLKWYIDSAHAYRDLPRPRIQWDAHE